MVAAVAEKSHLRTACSYQASPFVTMVALRPIFRPIGAAAPAFGPQGPSGGCRGADRSSDGRMTTIVPTARHDTTTSTSNLVDCEADTPAATFDFDQVQITTKGGAPRKKLTLMRVTPDTKNAKNHTKTKEQRPSRPQNEGAKADS